MLQHQQYCLTAVLTSPLWHCESNALGHSTTTQQAEPHLAKMLAKGSPNKIDRGMPIYIRPWGFTSSALTAKHSLRLKIKDAFHLQRVRFALRSRADLQSSAEIQIVVSWNDSEIVQWTKMFPCHSCRILTVLNMLALNEHAKVSKIKANPKAPLLGFTFF